MWYDHAMIEAHAPFLEGWYKKSVWPLFSSNILFDYVKKLLMIYLWFLSINASVTSSTEERKSKTVILMEKGKMYLHLNQFVNKVFIWPPFFFLLTPFQSNLVFASLISCCKIRLCYFLKFQNLLQIPILVIMKAMGMESDQEVVQMVGRDPRYSDLLLPSIEVNNMPTICFWIFLAFSCFLTAIV